MTNTIPVKPWSRKPLLWYGFFWTLTPFVPLLSCSIFSAFPSPFKFIPSELHSNFKWGRRRRRECSQLGCIPLAVFAD